jgi:hypothetical protein
LRFKLETKITVPVWGSILWERQICTAVKEQFSVFAKGSFVEADEFVLQFMPSPVKATTVKLSPIPMQPKLLIILASNPFELINTILEFPDNRKMKSK